MSTETPNPPPPKSPWLAAFAGAVVHTFILGTVGSFWLTYNHPRLEYEFAHHNVALSPFLQTMMDLGIWAGRYFYLGQAVLPGFLIVDLLILRMLGSPRSYRILREVWSGLVMALPALFLMMAASASCLPYSKFVEGLDRALDSREAAQNREYDLLAGAWELSAREQDGRREDFPSGRREVLRFGASRYEWQKGEDRLAGKIVLDLLSRPKGMQFLQEQGATGIGDAIYKIEGDQLILCASPHNSLDDPLGKFAQAFATHGTKNTLYVFRRLGAARGAEAKER